jgi:hypothetical protein
MSELHVVVAGFVMFNILELIMEIVPNYPTLVHVLVNIGDEDTTRRVLNLSISRFSPGRSPLEGYMKPTMSNTPTWSKRQETL